MTPYWWNDRLEDLYDLASQATGDLLGEVEALIEMELCRSSTLHMAVKMSGGDPLAIRGVGDDGGGSFVAYRHIVYLCEMLDRLERRELEHRNLLVTMPPQHGKECRVDEPILTPFGWTEVGKIAPGDEVFAPDGSVVRVLGVSPVNFDAPKMRVTLVDRTTLDVHPLHEWTVYDRSRAAWRTVETRYLASQSLFSGGRARFQLPTVEPLALPEADLPLDPYLVGLWLGDGTTGSDLIEVGSDEAEITAICAERGHAVRWRYEHPETGSVRVRFGHRAELREAEVLDRKRVPDPYLVASESQRRDLLAGLIDSDGSVDPDGRVRYVGHDEALVRDVAMLARTLGYRATVTSQVDTRPPHRVVFPGSDRVTMLATAGTRWVAAWTPHDGRGQGLLARKHVETRGTRRRVGIATITDAPSADGVCIEVEGGLYLVGRDLIPTHNSVTCSQFFPLRYLSCHPNESVLLASYEDNKASRWGRRVREKIRQHQDFLGISVASVTSAANRWELDTHGGGMQTAGVGGPLTGEPGHLIVIDDPVKNAKDAASQTLQDDNWDWYTDVVHTRRQRDTLKLLIQCMTGDTPVLMATGHEKQLRDVRPGDEIATYDNGRVSTSTVRNWSNNGPDYVYRIRMKSGTIVKANARHPFLVRSDDGVQWQRTDALRRGSRILRVTGANGEASPVPPKDASSQRPPRACATPTTARLGGPQESEPHRSILGLNANATSVTATESTCPTTKPSWPRKGGSAPSVPSRLLPRTLARIGAPSSASTTVTTRGGCGDSSATTATSWSDTASRRTPYEPPLRISTDIVLDVVFAGIADVYDIQVDRTENFIANGLVSHNTRWNEGDLAGRILEEEGDSWEVVNLPALAEEDDPLGREVGQPLCPERFNLKDLLHTQKLMRSSFSALYQQRPTPMEGEQFKKSWFRYFEPFEADEGYYRLRAEDSIDLVKVSDCFRFTTMDLADTVKKRSDFTVVGTWDLVPAIEHRDESKRRPARLCLVDLRRMQVEGDVHLPLLHEVDERFHPKWHGVEERFLGRQLIKRAIRDGLHVKGLKADKDKIARSETAAGWAREGRLYLRRGAHWLPAFERELLIFPNGRHDDQVDVVSYACEEADRMRWIRSRAAQTRKERRAKKNRTSLHPELGRV